MYEGRKAAGAELLLWNKEEFFYPPRHYEILLGLHAADLKCLLKGT